MVLQLRLSELGYYPYTVTGEFGSLTEKAVKAFQAANDLTVDGVFGPISSAKLYSAEAKRAPFAP
nr:peptidoglycan-binding domain-containing protein [bacterium]